MPENHLAGEKSPYLLQHVHNPVDWHPWGAAAFEKARKADKPILLSIGYSTCHWCHVMEHESFSDPAVAAVMNEHFVCVKVDREERPDVDKIYMTAVQLMTGQGGWPLNVFLTPRLAPFFGGTYFPPQARWGQPGFPSLLGRIASLWTTQRAEIDSNAASLTRALTAYAKAENARAVLDAGWLDKAFRLLQESFDAENAGFGGAPKFPMPVNLNFLLRYHARTGSQEAFDMARATLRAMSRGGIFDQVGGGFSRYSTDAQWRVPHFEKMLYDNAQIASCLVETCQVRPDAELEEAARRTLAYLLRDLRHPEGGFYSAEDADSLGAESGGKRKSEGAFYLWTEAELREVLGADAELFIRHFGVQEEGNAPNDPQGEFTGKNILYAKHAMEEERRRLQGSLIKLLERRAKRPRPSLDDKILASWNGLAISAFAKAAQVFGDQAYAVAATAAADFVREHLYDAGSRRLYHRWRDGQRAVGGIADDYAFLVQGLIDLYETTFESRWLHWAQELTETLERLFAAPEGGYFFTAEGHDKELILRLMDDSDNVEPCAGSVAALNLLRLAQITGKGELRRRAEKTLERFGSRLSERPLSLAQMLCAVDFALSKPVQAVFAGEVGSPAGQALLQELRSRFIPVKAVLRAEDSGLKQFTAVGGKPTAYLCVDLACGLPVTEAPALGALLDERLKR
jgi:uncharacterized protein YyaL (SSP411 family)